MDKILTPYGVASKPYPDLHSAASDTYTLSDGTLWSTRLTFDGNPFNERILKAQNVFEIGCGVGRNVPWIMQQTKANYFAVEPNDHMREHFFRQEAAIGKVFQSDWLPRCRVFKNFDDLDRNCTARFDLVLCTFVFQHIGYRPQPPVMNVGDITRMIRRNTTHGTIWFVYEHQIEEPGWLFRWLSETNFSWFFLDNKFSKIPDLLHRGYHTLVLAEE